MILPLHLGPLHPFEHALVAIIAFGPFLVLFAVVFWLRRRDIAEEERERPATDEHEDT